MTKSTDNTGLNSRDGHLQEDNSSTLPVHKSHVPSYEGLEDQLAEASSYVNDLILKNYLTRLTDFEVVPGEADLKDDSKFQMFKITEMVYQRDEYATHKFASVFNSLQHLPCGVFIVADSHGEKTDFYMGVRSHDSNNEYTTASLRETLINALKGQFPGIKTDNVYVEDAVETLGNIQTRNIASVTCVAQSKDEEIRDNVRFIQGLEKLALAMHGKRYTAVVLANAVSSEQLAEKRRVYEDIYTPLSVFANIQMSYGTNTALSLSNALSSGKTVGSSHSTNRSTQTGSSHSQGTSTNESTNTSSSVSYGDKGIKALGKQIMNIITLGTKDKYKQTSYSDSTSTQRGTGTSESHTTSTSETVGKSDSTNESTTENKTRTRGLTSGTSDNMQLTLQNKTLINMLERIDLQLKRIDECESLGMWECAAYFLSDCRQTAEMAARMYKAIMKGEKSGVETSAINFWGDAQAKQLPVLRDYITNFVHPVFEYPATSAPVPVTAASLVSGNELALLMGLPRKSVCGFPVVEHADFGKDVVRYSKLEEVKGILLGHIFTMGQESHTEVQLDPKSMTMHTFITGSTGSGKSNTIYEILSRLRGKHKIPFLVVEPAKGEYKNIFGQFPDVTVYGTNPKISRLLRINPFRFPTDIHVLEHLDRLVELFNVCWPMYAAMPAILKDAMERAYVACGWNLGTSENLRGAMFPNFFDLLKQIEAVINESKYSANSKGDYTGALCTRVRSLTNGLNGLIFCDDGLTDEELFDKSVIIDLSRVGSTETKSLIMGLLVLKLNEYRMTSGKMNSELSHVTVLEEAHNLLKRTSTEQSSESANLLGKSVELLANSIAEMRTYGEGFIIADQSPGLLDMSVIRNTNTKIILRLPDQGDRELVGLAAGLDEEQITELSKLERGVAAIYQNDWVEPVLVKVRKCSIDEKRYSAKPDLALSDLRAKQVSNALLHNPDAERLAFRLLNTLLVEDFGLCKVALDKAKKQLRRLALKNSPNMDNLQQGAIQLALKELLIQYFMRGLHQLKALPSEELSQYLADYIESGNPNALEKFKAQVSKEYQQDCLKFGLRAVSTWIKEKRKQDTDIDLTITNYFIELSDQRRSELKRLIGGTVQ